MVDFTCVEGKHWKYPQAATECHRKYWHNGNCDFLHAANNVSPPGAQAPIVSKFNKATICPTCNMQSFVSRHCTNPDCVDYGFPICPRCSANLHWECDDGLWECENCGGSFNHDLRPIDAREKYRRETIIIIVAVCLFIIIALLLIHPNW